MAGPIEQFEIKPIFTLFELAGQEIAFTNSSAYMFGAVAIVSVLMRSATLTTEAELMQTVFPHPTISESMHESVLAAYGRALHI